MTSAVVSTIKFQSTLSMRRATSEAKEAAGEAKISIHALHEESDDLHRLPCRNRMISIHALHEESDK